MDSCVCTTHGMNDVILETGLAVDYNEVSRDAEKLRLGMTKADSVDIDFEVEHKNYHLHIDLGKQEAQKSHGLCHEGPDIANYLLVSVFCPSMLMEIFQLSLKRTIHLDLTHVDDGKAISVSLIRGNKKTVDKYQAKFTSDPASSILGELGFGTQVLPYSTRDIQDEKIFGTFHLATGRNDHLNGK